MKAAGRPSAQRHEMNPPSHDPPVGARRDTCPPLDAHSSSQFFLIVVYTIRLPFRTHLPFPSLPATHTHTHTHISIHTQTIAWRARARRRVSLPAITFETIMASDATQDQRDMGRGRGERTIMHPVGQAGREETIPSTFFLSVFPSFPPTVGRVFTPRLATATQTISAAGPGLDESIGSVGDVCDRRRHSEGIR